MIFNGINGQKLELRLIPFDPHEFELMTGFKVEDNFQPTIVDFNLIIGNKNMYSSILISDVIELIDWFEKFLLNKTVDSTSLFITVNYVLIYLMMMIQRPFG